MALRQTVKGCFHTCLDRGMGGLAALKVVGGNGWAGKRGPCRKGADMDNEKKYFKVAITETLRRVVTVEAKDEEDARQRVMDSWKNSEVILVAEDFEGAEFYTVGEGTAEEAEKEKAAREALDFRTPAGT